jgi:hypothetical protein
VLKNLTVSWETGFKYPNVEITEEETRRHRDLAIESEYLDAKLDVANEMCRSVDQTSIWERKYILDIDLDYFTTEKSIAPNDARTFHKLIRNAEAITVALEPTYVLAERINGETITSEFLLSRFLEHLRSALSERRS